MPRFNYKIKDQNALSQKGIVEAASIRSAASLLHEKGYTIIELKQIRTSSIVSLNIRRGRISFTDLVHITRQLSTMLTAGLTLVEALAVLRQQLSKSNLIKLISEIEDQVKGEGKSMVSVLEKYPFIFPPLYIALIRAGEASGKLDVILARLADNLEKSRDFRNKVKGALVYPAIVIVGMISVSVIVMTIVVPRLSSLYKEFGINLPLPTRILIAISNFFTSYWYIVIVMTAAIVVSYLKFRQTDFGKHLIAAFLLRLPIFGNLVKQSSLTEITRTMAMLVDSGVPILTTLDIVQEATDNILYKEIFIEASKKVEKGYPLSDPLSSSSLFPPILAQMVAIGEHTGKLGESFMKLSYYFETESEGVVRSLTTMIEPLIMVILGLGVGFIVMAVLLPIYSLTSKF